MSSFRQILSGCGLVLVISLISACSSSTSSTSGGGDSQWRGHLQTSAGEAIAFQLSLQFSAANEDETFPEQNISGVFSTSTSNRCFTGGTVESGTLDGGKIQFTVTHGGGTLSFSGSMGRAQMSGLWSNTGTVTIETEGTNDEGETETESREYNCASSGEFYAQ